MNRLQNSRIFGERERRCRSIFERKVWSECKNGEGQWGETLKTTPCGRVRLARHSRITLRLARHSRITLMALRAFRNNRKRLFCSLQDERINKLIAERKLCLVKTETNWNEKRSSRTTVSSSSETQGRLAGEKGNKSGKATKRRRFTSQAKKAPGNRLLQDNFQSALPMLPPD